MFFLGGAAATSALNLISALQKTLGDKGSSTSPANSQSFDLGAGGATASSSPPVTATAPLAPATMNALLSAQGDSQKPVVNGDAFSKQLFGLLDTNGDGSITQSEMDSIFNRNGDTTKADAIFARLDANHDGSVNLDELTNALSGQGQAGQGVNRHRHHHSLADLIGANSLMGSGNANSLMGSGNSNDPFSSSFDPFSGNSNQTVTNTDGSTTMTITNADGSQVSITLPAATGTGSSPAETAHNMIERMIQRQMQMMASSFAGQGFALSA